MKFHRIEDMKSMPGIAHPGDVIAGNSAAPRSILALHQLS
jgi:hypothetical protein